MDLLEVMAGARAMRWLKPDPVPPELLELLIWAAAAPAPSPGNSQAWDFIVITDRAILAWIGDAVASSVGSQVLPSLSDLDPGERRMVESSLHLATGLADVPCLIVVAGRSVFPPGAPDDRFVWATLYPAAQNLVLAARSLGLGATFTTLHLQAETAFREILSIPEGVLLAAVIPVGWPAKPFGPVRRKPVSDVVHRDGWGSQCRERTS